MNPQKAGRSLNTAASRDPVVSVLLVDEDASDLEAFSILLEKDGYAVRACDNHADALRRLESEVFDFIIVSQGSPAFEGPSILRRANEIDRELPVLVLARCHEIGCYLEAMQLGALEYLEKPLPAPELLQFVKNHLRARSQAS
jgi:DNA-binding NtrC family response regulator